VKHAERVHVVVPSVGAGAVSGAGVA
jgi:hypothetical protein